MGKTCTELFAGIDCTILGNADDEVNGIAYRSDRVQPGDAFFCVVGMTTDGHSFAQDAIDRGAKVLVVERKVYLADATDVTEIVVKDTRKAMAAAAANFYDHPSKDLALVGITGTNGKTTTTYLVEHIARVAGKRTGVIGTVGIRIGDEAEKSAHTTPESPDLQQLFARMREDLKAIDALAAETGRDAKAITAFKNLAFRAVAEASSELEGQNDVGILVDDTYGQSVLFESNRYPFWVGRSIEKTGVNPLMFEGKADVGSTLQAWPENHVVKCLFRPGAKDAPEVVEENERQLCRLFSGARSTGHDLLLEIIVDQPQTREEQDACLLRWMRRCYELGVYPDYWKILPVADQGTWQAIEALIGEYDPYCRGILFLGLNVAEAELVKRFAALPESPRALGFAIGRSIFLEPARKWFAGQMSDEDAVATMRDCFLRLARAWNGRNRG